MENSLFYRGSLSEINKANYVFFGEIMYLRILSIYFDLPLKYRIP